MSELELSHAHKSYLNDCRIVAQENSDFYEQIYHSGSEHFDPEVIGRMMAQKRDFIDAVSRILTEYDASAGGAPVAPKTQKLVLSLPNNASMARAKDKRKNNTKSSTKTQVKARIDKGLVDKGPVDKEGAHYVRSKIDAHETRFDEALALTHDFVENDDLRALIDHHREASQIALSALMDPEAAAK